LLKDYKKNSVLLHFIQKKTSEIDNQKCECSDDGRWKFSEFSVVNFN